MVARKRVGLIFSYNENWIAGSYYILNLVHAINTLKSADKPELVIFSDSLKTYNILVNETNYPFLKFEEFPKQIKYSLLEKSINKMARVCFNRKLIKKDISYVNVDFLYPRQVNKISDNIKKVNWVPDFQEDHLPQFFSNDEIKSRKSHQENIVSKGDVVVFSSEDAKNDFIRLYPKSKSDLFVLRFAVTHPDFSKESIEALKLKYNLPLNYYFAPNQFWAHKNHIVILKAVKLLKEKGINITVAMSGKENDYRNEQNFKTLKEYINENDLKNNIKFLGFLPREEQLCLFNNAKAIIQPSLFEGWSTVVEDSKALNKFLILSDLAVHKEQIKENVLFFNPYNFQNLAEVLTTFETGNYQVNIKDYNKDILEFGETFNALINTYNYENSINNRNYRSRRRLFSRVTFG